MTTVEPALTAVTPLMAMMTPTVAKAVIETSAGTVTDTTVVPATTSVVGWPGGV